MLKQKGKKSRKMLRQAYRKRKKTLRNDEKQEDAETGREARNAETGVEQRRH